MVLPDNIQEQELSIELTRKLSENVSVKPVSEIKGVAIQTTTSHEHPTVTPSSTNLQIQNQISKAVSVMSAKEKSNDKASVGISAISSSKKEFVDTQTSARNVFMLAE